MLSLPNACVASTQGPRQIGGVTAYVDSLTEHLRADWEWRWLTRLDSGTQAMDWRAWEPRQTRLVGSKTVCVLEPDPRWRVALPAVKRAMFIRGAWPAAVRTYTGAYGDPARAAMAPDTALIHYAGTGWELFGFALLAAARRVGVPFTVHPSLHEDEWGDSELDGRLYRQADWMFAQTPRERAALVRLGVDPARITVAGPGPGVHSRGDRRRFRKHHGLNGEPVVLFVGRRTRSKGYHALCAAMSTVWRTVDSCRLVVIGPTPEPPYPALRDDRVIDLGTASEDAKADAFAACDLVCVPSASESFGIVYVEAWSYGRTVIAGPAPAVQDLVDEGVDGYRVPQDPARIAARIVELLGNPALRERMGRAGRDKQSRDYSWSSVASVYRETWARLAVPDKAAPAGL